MEKDRTEMHDLATSQAERVQGMAALWENWAQRTKATPWPWGKPYGEEKPKRKVSPKKAK